MLRITSLLVLLACAGSAPADDKKVSIKFLGGAKRAPLNGLKVTIRGDTGDWTADKKNKLADGVTDKNGAITFALAPGRYYIDVASDKELPYLPLPVGYKGYPGHYDRTIRVGADAAQSFDFNRADACKLFLRAVDADTGKPMPGRGIRDRERDRRAVGDRDPRRQPRRQAHQGRRGDGQGRVLHPPARSA